MKTTMLTHDDYNIFTRHEIVKNSIGICGQKVSIIDGSIEIVKKRL